MPAKIHKPIKHYLLVLLEDGKCFSHEESKVHWVNLSILHTDSSKQSSTFCRNLTTCFLNSSCTLKLTFTSVQLRKMSNVCLHALEMFKFRKKVNVK